MATKLIEHLKAKSNEHDQLRLLVSQWEFDQNLVSKALQNVGQFFPHYSRHDASHSLQILVNIERLLGEDINKLTATDTWLILEAAYWHDIGMIVPADKVLHDLKTKEFERFIAKITDTAGHELRDFAKKFNPDDASACFTDISSPVKAAEKLRQLVAEYYRQQHPKRSEVIVLNPWEEASINSPRNELLPKRLFSLLGRICHLHGKDFSSILNELDFRQVGMGGENCHPRFIACLLRLGDLLDIEDNRFCPVMLRMVDNIPCTSQAHIDKHNSIHHFRLDRERIEITAYCNNAAAFEETERWFNWIKQEIQQQMAYWQDIVPERAFGLLPTPSGLRVVLDGDEQWLDFNSKERPRFDINPEKTIELLQGAGLYKTREQSLRELLQNSVDATLQRIWLEFSPNVGKSPLPENLKPDDWDNPYDPKMLALLKQYPITINFEPIADQASDKLASDKCIWELTITDHGIGISKDDLKHMRHIGATNKDMDKKERIKKMSKWMRPSGAFGIGLQSAFMLTEKISFRTKSYLTREAHEITLYSPLSSDRGLITIKKCETLLSDEPYGSTLKILHEFEKLPVSFSLRHGEHEAYKAFQQFDPIEHQTLEIEPAKWLSEITKFAQNSPIPIICSYKGEPYKIEQFSDIKQKPYFDKATDIALEIYEIPNASRMRYTGSEELYFRGQIVADYKPFTSFINIKWHLWGNDASELLTINRNDIKDNSYRELDKKQKIALINYLNDLSHKTIQDDLRQSLSAFIKISRLDQNRPDFKEEWKNLPLVYSRDNGTRNFNDLIQLKSFIIYTEHQIPLNLKGKLSDMATSTDNCFKYDGFHIVLRFINHQLQESGFKLQIINKNNSFTEFQFKKGEPCLIDYFSKPVLKAILLSSIKSHDISKRMLFPVYPDYEKLKLKNDKKYYFLKDFPESQHLLCKYMLMPFIFDRNSEITVQANDTKLDALCKWTVAHAEDTTLTIEEARDLYRKFISWIDGDIMKADPDWKKMRGLKL